jgi:16S rRNA (cytosine967-C5)-methyltransferase
VISARDYALAQLDARRLPHWPPDLLRQRGTSPSTNVPADPRDRALAEQIVNGVLKNLLYLQNLIAHLTQRSIKRTDPLVQKILAIGLYQLRFLTRVPASAAVDEAVKQAKRVGHVHAAGFINAALRRAARESDPPAPDAALNPDAYAEVALSHPADLFARLVKLLGTADALKFCEHDNLEPPTIVRLAPSSTARELDLPGVTVMPHERPGFFIVSPAKAPTLADWAQRGVAQAQDPTSALAVAQLDIQPGQTILDRSSGVRTKTVQILELAGPTGRIIAMDPSEPRIGILARLVGERNLANIHPRKVGMILDIAPSDPKQFHRILIDAPCSNSGVLARRPEARYNQSDAAIASVTKLQDRILSDSAPALIPGGRMVYSTCSVWSEENELRIQEFLKQRPDYELFDQHTTLPSFDPDPTKYHDAGYYAVLKRK